MPDTWEGPPVEKPASGARETYELGDPGHRLRVTRDDGEYRRRIDRLTWVFNQSVPRAPIGASARAWYLNASKWGWPPPKQGGDSPERWTGAPSERPWTTGGVTYVPPEQR